MVDGPDRWAAALLALAGTLFTAVVELCGHPAVFGPWSPLPAVLAGLVFAALSTITPLRRKARLAAYVRAGSWVFAGGWVAYGYEWGLTGRYWHVRTWRAETWSQTYWQVGLLAAAAAVAAAAVFATPTDLGQPAAQPEVQAAGLDPGDPVGEHWAQVIAAGSKGAVTGAYSITEHDWPTGAGYTVRGKLADGRTWEDLAKHTAGIAAVLDLDAGGGVSVEPDGGAAGFAMKVLTQDAMAQPVAYPGAEEEG
jgi:hypothetical protein